MKRPLVVPLLVLILPLVLTRQAASQGWGPTPAEEAKIITSLGLVAGKVVGEIGAGDGQLTIAAAKAVSPGGRVFASELGDAKRDTLKRSAETGGVKNVAVVEARIETTGFALDCCDAIFMRDVYHHLTAPKDILADILKSLRPQARLLIIDFEPRGGLSPVEGVPENRRGHGIPMDVVVEELKATGFEVISQDGAWRSDLYAVIAKNPAQPVLR